MEKPQDCSSNHIAIMLPVSRLRSPVCMVQILDTAAIDPQLDLPPDHVFVKSQMGLRREESPLDVDTLHFSMATMAPDNHPRARSEQPIGLLRRRWCHHVVLMHLVQVDAAVICSEQLLSHWREVNPRVTELPILGRGRGDLGAQHSA